MKLFVTGGAGFIGSNFVHFWLKHHPEDHIVTFDALTYAGNLQNLATIENTDYHTFIKGDIRDPLAVREAMKGADTVVHFAAESHVDRSILDPSSFVTTNVVGTQVLLDAARDLGISRFHHVSTDEVFGSLELGSEEKFTEKSHYDPRSPYSASKAGSDHLVRAYGETFNLPFTITNCSNNYGPYHFPEKLIPLVITNIMENQPIPVYGDGLNVRDWLHVEDHCRAIEAVLKHGELGETYLIGGMNEDISNIDLVKLLIELMDADESLITYVEDRAGHDRRYAVDWTNTQANLGWSPSVTLEEGLEKTIAWYRQNEDWWRSVKSGAYQDYYKKQYGEK